MPNEIVCNIDMFSTNQRIYFPDGTNDIVPTENISHTLVGFCYAKNIMKLHLFGAEDYLKGLMANINVENMWNYGNEKIEVKIN